MTQTDRERAVRALIETVTGKTPASDNNLLGSGFMDSLMVMQLVGALEAKFAIHLEIEDFTQYNFDSVAAIAALVERREK